MAGFPGRHYRLQHSFRVIGHVIQRLPGETFKPWKPFLENVSIPSLETTGQH